jgi:predicted TIM-barrel fold metal-dependent hydrolase
VAALTTARKKTAAREAKKAYEKRKTRAAQVTATREQAAADAEVDPVARQAVSAASNSSFGGCGAAAGPQVVVAR